jgi:hypothetical protein
VAYNQEFRKKQYRQHCRSISEEYVPRRTQALYPDQGPRWIENMRASRN